MSQPFDFERLGKGFHFETRQRRSSFDDSHFPSSPTGWRRYVPVDLKAGKLTDQDVGQMQTYVNYFDRHVRTGDELPTIGSLLCHQKSEAVVGLTLFEDAIDASKYELYLPSREELADQVSATYLETVPVRSRSSPARPSSPPVRRELVGGGGWNGR